MAATDPGQAALPTLRTPRLLLRPLVPADMPALVRLHRDPQVARHALSPPGSDAEAEARARANIFRAWPPGLGFWAVEEGAAFLGWAMLVPFDGEGPDVEIGYRLHAHAWGRGVGTEAAARLAAHGLGALALPRLLAIARPGNPASHRVLAKTGFQLAGPWSGHGVDWLLFRRDAGPWTGGGSLTMPP